MGFFDELERLLTGSYPRRRPTSAQRQKVDARDGSRCGVCGEFMSARQRAHWDHKNALARGGTNSTRNFQRAHPRCNLKKGTRRQR